MKILVTGATGYVGHNLALTLAKQGYEVNILVRNPVSAFIPKHRRINIFKGDILKKDTIAIAMQNCEWVFHVAAMVGLWAKQPSVFYDINVEGTRNLLNEALLAGVKKFCFTSTCGVIGPSLKEPMSETDPRITAFNSDYELSKFLAEKLIGEYAVNGLFAITVSPSKIFGPGIETHPISVNEIVKKYISGKITFCPKPPQLLSNYVFIDDLVKGHILAMEKGRPGEKYILGGENLSYAEFFETLGKLSGKKGKLILASKNVAKIYGWLHFIQSKMQRKAPFFTAYAVHHIYCNKSFSSAKAQKELGYTITPITEALQKTIQFLNRRHYA